jgi:diguanylate cyclase (GGDEF)-like protein
VELLNNINFSLLNILSEQINVLIWAKDLEGNYIFSNKEFSTKILSTNTIEDNNFLYDSFIKRCLYSDKEIIKKEKTIKYKEYFKEDDVYKVYDIVKSPLLNNEGVIIGTVGTAQDITKEILLEKELKQNYYYDEITKLPNKKYLLKYLSSIKNNKENYYSGSLLLDIDDFKFVNDTLGHHKGDNILSKIAELLNNSVNKMKLKYNKEFILIRFGGDKFLVFIEDISKEKDIVINELIGISKILSKNIESIFNDKRYKIKINLTVSTGIDFFLNSKIKTSNFSDKLLKNLELALYSAKIEKNNYKFYVQKLSDEQSNILSIGRDLYKAIQSNEFELYFQPQFLASNEKLFSAEVLIRWNHPEKGLISPEVFIPIAEDKGLILELGRWIIEESIKILSKWSNNEKLKYLELAVNVSVKQFHDLNFIPFVKSNIEKYKIQSNNLMFELTESIFSENIDIIIEKMDNLNEIGLKMSLDDFGTGFSSLSYLKQLPLKQIKIDKSFVDGILINENDKAIVLATIFIGSTMGLDVIAEGIEKYEQSVYLKKIGCNQFQGYLYSKPLPLKEFEEFALNYKNF